MILEHRWKDSRGVINRVFFFKGQRYLSNDIAIMLRIVVPDGRPFDLEELRAGKYEFEFATNDELRALLN